MPATVKIIHATDFIKATAEGELDLAESKRLLAEIASATDLADCEVILDTRKAHSSLSADDLWHFAAVLGRVRMALPRKTAVLCPQERFDHAAFFSLCAQCSGFKVRAFTSFEEAVNWLMLLDEPDPKTVSGSQEPAAGPCDRGEEAPEEVEQAAGRQAGRETGRPRPPLGRDRARGRHDRTAGIDPHDAQAAEG